MGFDKRGAVMKYVKTKDNIYEIINDYGSSCAVKSRGKRGKTAIDGFIIKYGLTFAPRADTIQKLCDEIVEIIDGKAQVVYADISFNDLAIAKIRNKNNAIVYGAIWTDKGLIYVAKMNEDGELCLI